MIKEEGQKKIVKSKFLLPLKICAETHSVPRVTLTALSISPALSETNPMGTQHPLKTKDWRLKVC